MNYHKLVSNHDKAIIYHITIQIVDFEALLAFLNNYRKIKAILLGNDHKFINISYQAYDRCKQSK